MNSKSEDSEEAAEACSRAAGASTVLALEEDDPVPACVASRNCDAEGETSMRETVLSCGDSEAA